MGKKAIKPIELFIFIDPINPACWSLEPVLQKLRLEYGHYMSAKIVLSGNLNSFNIQSPTKHLKLADLWERIGSASGMSCDGNIWREKPIESPYKASIAIKAAEMQGRTKGAKFLRHLQEALFIYNIDVTQTDNLTQIAKKIGLDVEEFKYDLYSEQAANYFKRDLLVSSEMYVDDTPSLVFFNHNIEDEGLKLSGVFSYSVYEQILAERLGEKPVKASLPPMETFITHAGIVATVELCSIYELSEAEVTSFMRKLQIAGRVKKIEAKHGDFWKANRKKFKVAI